MCRKGADIATRDTSCRSIMVFSSQGPEPWNHFLTFCNSLEKLHEKNAYCIMYYEIFLAQVKRCTKILCGMSIALTKWKLPRTKKLLLNPLRPVSFQGF